MGPSGDLGQKMGVEAVVGAEAGVRQMLKGLRNPWTLPFPAGPECIYIYIYIYRDVCICMYVHMSK